ncbi:MAG: DUF378 domain-containing protein [Clostridiales bacterium]|nr:DUF378 domain-containing protein [Clostridiales bacterium]
MRRNGFDRLTLILIVIGALNWLLVGLFNFNLVEAIFGTTAFLTKLIYILVGISGIYCISLLFRESGHRAEEKR